LDGSGTAQQITTYQVILRNYVWFHINEPTECFSVATYTTRGESTESIFPIIVYVDDAIIDVSYDEHYLPLTTEVDGNECYWLNGSPPVEPQPILWKYDRWYHQGSFSGEDLSIVGRDPYPGFTYETEQDRQTRFTIYSLTRDQNDTQWLSQQDKEIFTESSEILSRTAATQVLSSLYYSARGNVARAGGHAAVSIASSSAALIDGLIGLDPPDPNYTEIAVPVTPTTSQQPILSGEDLTQAEAEAFNALLTNLDQGIGLARAILTSFNRASGAQVAEDGYWVDQQLQAAWVFSGQYADVLDARPQLQENLKQALLADPDNQFDITGDDYAALRYDLVTEGLSAEQEQLLTELGVDELGQTEILHALILTEYPAAIPGGDIIAQYPDFLTDPALIENIQALAGALREFSEGQGWKLYIPTVMR